MERFLKTSIIAVATLMTPVPALAGAQVEVSVAFAYDSAQSADTNYAKMQKKAKTACKVLDTSSDALWFSLIRKAQRECAAELVSRGVEKFAYSDLTSAHRAATGESAVRTAQVIN